MEQIEGDTALMGMISEMFFEQHYNDFDVSGPPHTPLRWHIGLLSSTPQALAVCRTNSGLVWSAKAPLALITYHSPEQRC